jgi:glycosyltransferase involved in cell wall biosynthesis
VNQKPSIHASIIIPTHNRAELLRQTLESLKELVIPADQMLELVVIANACTDHTQQVCQAGAAMIPFPVRCIVEPQPGASQARNRAIVEARGEILAFLDDDVWVNSHWLTGLLAVLEHYPADVVAGKVTLWWKTVEKPVWMTHRSEHLLSSVDYGPAVKELFTGGEAISANLAIRRRVLADVPAFRTDLDRQGRVVLAGGDTYFINQALKTGHRMFYAPDAAVQHWVSPERITLPYLSRAARANGLARIAMMEQRSAATGTRLGLENALKYCFYFVMEMLSAATWNMRGKVNNRIRRMTSQGILEALGWMKKT